MTASFLDGLEKVTKQLPTYQLQAEAGANKEVAESDAMLICIQLDGNGLYYIALHRISHTWSPSDHVCDIAKGPQTCFAYPSMFCFS